MEHHHHGGLVGLCNSILKKFWAFRAFGQAKKLAFTKKMMVCIKLSKWKRISTNDQALRCRSDV